MPCFRYSRGLSAPLPSRRWCVRAQRFGTAGAAAVEFAIIAPVLLMLLGAAADLGRAIDRSIRLSNAVRAAAQYVVLASDDTTNAAATLAGSMISDLTGYSVTVSAISCECPNSTATTFGNVVNCNSSCGSGLAQFVTVTATAPFTPLFPLSSILPFETIGATSASAVVRLI